MGRRPAHPPIPTRLRPLAGAFLVVAVATSSVSELARARAVEAERRRAEADLTAEMAQVLLARAGVEDALPPIGRRLAAVFGLPWASISLLEQGGDARRDALPLSVGGRRLGTLVVPSGLRPSVSARLRERVVPALAAVLDVALERERLVAERVETEALRRSDAVKTAVLPCYAPSRPDALVLELQTVSQWLDVQD